MSLHHEAANSKFPKTRLLLNNVYVPKSHAFTVYMGQIFSCAGKFRRKTKRQTEEQDQPDLPSQAVRTQIGDSASAATQSQHEEQQGNQHGEQHGEQHKEQDEEEYQSSSVVMGLPLDVILIIFDLLEVHDAVAFSLACKGLHEHLFANARALFKAASKEDKFKTQTMLEKDLAHDQIYCPFCRTFHSLHNEYRQANCAEKAKPQLSVFATYIPGELASAVSYLDARAVMNAVSFKRPCAEEYLKFLDRRFRIGTPESSWYQVWAPRVIKGELFLLIVTGHDRVATAGDKDEFVLSVCKHVTIQGKFPHIWAYHSELSWMCLFADRRLAAGTCRTCHADWRLLMEWVEGKGEGAPARAGWDIFIRSWHRLGPLRSPWDPRWARGAGEERSPKTKWIDGDSTHIIDHDGWDEQFAGYPASNAYHGPAELMWEQAEEKGC